MKAKKAFVIWAKQVKLSEFLAKKLNAQVIISCRKKWRGFDIPVVFRYLIQSIDTYRKLRKIRPDVIFVENPPIVSVLVAYIYCKINSSQFIIDTHTAGFLDKKWIFFHPLHKFLAKRALFNTVHNYKNLEIQKKWGINNSKVLQFYNPKREEIVPTKDTLDQYIRRKLSGQPGLKIFIVNRFADDDAWQEVIETAKRMKDALFFITGDKEKLESNARKTIPSNVVLTGYLNHGEFIELMDKCDISLAFTKRKDTVLWSVREIMALKKPFIVNDSAVMRHYFEEVALFSDMSPEDLSEKIKEAWKERFEIKGKIEKFVDQDRVRWENDIAEIEKIIEESMIEKNKKIRQAALLKMQ